MAELILGIIMVLCAGAAFGTICYLAGYDKGVEDAMVLDDDDFGEED